MTFAAFVVSAGVFGATGLVVAAAGAAAIAPATYAVMLPNEDPAELTRVG